MPDFNTSGVDYGLLIPWKSIFCKRLFPVTSPPLRICARNSNDSALTMLPGSTIMLSSCSLKEANGGGAWSDWDESLRKRAPATLEKARKEYAESILRYSFYQFLVLPAMDQIASLCHERGIRIIGDIPIFIAYDSADAGRIPTFSF